MPIPYSVLPGTPYPPRFVTTGHATFGGTVVSCFEYPDIAIGEELILVAPNGSSFQTTCVDNGRPLVVADPLPMSFPLGSHLVLLRDISPEMRGAWIIDSKVQADIAREGGDVDGADPTEVGEAGLGSAGEPGSSRNNSRRRTSDGGDGRTLDGQES